MTDFRFNFRINPEYGTKVDLLPPWKPGEELRYEINASPQGFFHCQTYRDFAAFALDLHTGLYTHKGNVTEIVADLREYSFDAKRREYERTYLAEEDLLNKIASLTTKKDLLKGILLLHTERRNAGLLIID